MKTDDILLFVSYYTFRTGYRTAGLICLLKDDKTGCYVLTL